MQRQSSNQNQELVHLLVGLKVKTPLKKNFVVTKVKQGKEGYYLKGKNTCWFDSAMVSRA